MGRRMVGKCAVLLFLAALWPTPVQAEDPHGIGVVTTLTGQATITRAAVPLQSSPLKFRDELFYRDHISTKEHSMARVLLGGKALITVRELSELTITEEPGRQSIVDLAIGKLSMAVVRSRMNPGETIEVRTPNAVAGVRGTVLIVEVTPALATEIYVLKGSVEVFAKGVSTAPIFVNAFQSVVVTGNHVGQIRSIQALAVDQIVRNLKPAYQHLETPDKTKKAMQEKEQARALTQAKALTALLPAPVGFQEQDVTKEAGKTQEAKKTERSLILVERPVNTTPSGGASANPGNNAVAAGCGSAGAGNSAGSCGGASASAGNNSASGGSASANAGNNAASGGGASANAGNNAVPGGALSATAGTPTLGGGLPTTLITPNLGGGLPMPLVTPKPGGGLPGNLAIPAQGGTPPRK